MRISDWILCAFVKEGPYDLVIFMEDGVYFPLQMLWDCILRYANFTEENNSLCLVTHCFDVVYDKICILILKKCISLLN